MIEAEHCVGHDCCLTHISNHFWSKIIGWLSLYYLSKAAIYIYI